MLQTSTQISVLPARQTVAKLGSTAASCKGSAHRTRGSSAEPLKKCSKACGRTAPRTAVPRGGARRLSTTPMTIVITGSLRVSHTSCFVSCGTTFDKSRVPPALCHLSVFRHVSYAENAADLLQNRAWAGSFHVTHYTSKNLADWQFESFLPNASSFGKSRYDSVVFRIKDGRFILVSAGNAPPNLQSYDLHSWQVVNDSSLKCGFGAAEFPTTCTDEGPHATRWNGKLWFNMEPRECDQSSNYLRSSSDCYARASSLTLAGYHTAGCDDTTSTRTHCQNKSVLCSDDGGESFKNQPFNIFEDNAFSTRYLDDGQAHQGPLLGQGSRALVMYFAENVYSLGSDMASINNQRSVLQVAPVVESADGWLHANRSGHVPLPLLPPNNITMIDRGPILPQTQPTTWHVKAEDAMIIAAAELNRWTPRWCPDEDSSHELLPGYKLHAAPFCTTYTKDSAACVAACANNDTCAAVVVTTGAACAPPRPMDPSGVQLNTQALAELFSSAKVDTALECKALCVKTKGCGSLVFRHKGSSPGEGACGAVNETCCYLLHDANPKMIPHAGWDAWAKGGSASSCSGAGIKPTHSSACCSFVSQTALDRESDLDVMIHNTSSWAKEGILTSTVMPWRDQTRVGRYFEPPAHSGADPYGWVWNLRTSSNLRHRVTQRPLQFSLRISANGTILSMANLTTSPARPMEPLRQFRRDSWSPKPPAELFGHGHGGDGTPRKSMAHVAERPLAQQGPPLALDLTGCWEMGASNGRAPAEGCGTAPLDKGDGLMYIAQHRGGTIDACLSQACYRPATGVLSNTSIGAGMLRMHTLTDRGNCTNRFIPSFPADGLLEYFNWILPVGWPSSGNATWGTHVSAADLSGVFVNNDNAAGDAGGIFLSRHVDQAACDGMRALPDCTAAPPPAPVSTAGAASLGAHAADQSAACNNALRKNCGQYKTYGLACMTCLELPAHHAAIKKAGCSPPDVAQFCGPPAPPEPPDVKLHNATGCYLFGGSAGMSPADGCGMAPAAVNGHAFVVHRADGSVNVCLNQFCSRVLSGEFRTASNGVGFMTTETLFNQGNCTSAHSKNFPEDGLFAHIDFVFPAGWPNTTAKTRGTNTVGAHSITGMFVNNGPHLAGTLTMDPGIDPSACDIMRELPYCRTFLPPPPPVLAAGGGSSLLKTDDDHFVASCPLNADDCTGELMAALNHPGVSTVIVPSYPRAVWPVTPLEMGNAASNRRVIFRPGLTIEAKRGAFQGGADSLLMCRNLENVSFEGSGGATFLMHRRDYANSSLYNHSESRMGVELHGCRNVSLSGLNINSTVSGANTWIYYANVAAMFLSMYSIGDEFVSRVDVRLISVACVQGGDGIYISGTGGHVVLPNGTRVYVCQRNESRDITIRNVHCHNNYR